MLQPLSNCGNGIVQFAQNRYVQICAAFAANFAWSIWNLISAESAKTKALYANMRDCGHLSGHLSRYPGFKGLNLSNHDEVADRVEEFIVKQNGWVARETFLGTLFEEVNSRHRNIWVHAGDEEKRLLSLIKVPHSLNLNLANLQKTSAQLHDVVDSVFQCNRNLMHCVNSSSDCEGKAQKYEDRFDQCQNHLSDQRNDVLRIEKEKDEAQIEMMKTYDRLIEKAESCQIEHSKILSGYLVDLEKLKSQIASQNAQLAALRVALEQCALIKDELRKCENKGFAGRMFCWFN